MVSDTQTARYFPYVGAAGWLTKLHQACIRSMPSRIEVDWLTDRIGLKPVNARQLSSFMQRVGWVDSDGGVLDDGKRLRLVGDSWQDAMKETTEGFYSDLLERIRSAAKFRPQDLEQFFTDETSMGHSGRQQMMAVFRWFLREANLTDVEQTIWPAPGASQRRGEIQQERAKPAGSRTRESTKAKDRSAADQRIPNQQAGPMDTRLATIASVLKINIDGTWEENRIAATFRMLDRLLKGEPVDA